MAGYTSKARFASRTNNPSLDELIKAADLAQPTLRERLDANDLDSLLQQVVYLRARRKTSVLPEEEAQLLLKIDRGIPADLLAQYQILLQKRDAETLRGCLKRGVGGKKSSQEIIGYDAGKKIKGRNRFITVDTLGSSAPFSNTLSSMCLLKRLN